MLPSIFAASTRAVTRVFSSADAALSAGISCAVAWVSATALRARAMRVVERNLIGFPFQSLLFSCETRRRSLFAHVLVGEPDSTLGSSPMACFAGTCARLRWTGSCSRGQQDPPSRPLPSAHRRWAGWLETQRLQ